MLELAFTAADLARVRFAVSPLWEVVASIRALREPVTDSVHRPWADQVRPGLRRHARELEPLIRLVPVPTHVLPHFLSPPPTVPQPDLALELAALDRPDLVPLIRLWWDLALQPWWPRILALHQGDILHRARLLTEGGTQRLFDDFDPQVRWDGSVLRVVNRFSRSVRIGGRGLLLVPSVFAWPRVFAKLDPPWQPTLRYPPRGLGTLWERRPPPAGLSAVLGATRTRLLVEMSDPAATTDLARRTGLSAGAVSQHLGALRGAGLVTARRAGRYVLYSRTAVAEALLSGRA
jgi:DNA-binding transcriptional ArsR family regulator